MISVLIADDDKTNLYLLKIFCREKSGVKLIFASNGQEALGFVKKGEVDILITDLRMPVLSGDELMTTVKKEYPHIPVIIMTGYGSIEGAVDYLRRGADDYLTKPLTKDVFLHRLERVVAQVTLTKEVHRLKSLGASGGVDQIIGKSPPMLLLKNQLPTLAQTEASIVILGESGTGKEVIARALHSLSRRNAQPFVTVNCGALPENLLEAELFGYKRGAFTGATDDNMGLVGAADGGTLFLDEIGEISLAVQVKLLRFLELKEYKPVGSPESRIANVRIISATNRDLKQGVADKTFREDLYYRLNVVPVQLASLKEREGDIPLLAATFLERSSQRFGKKLNLTPTAMRKLESYAWPGNIRELENKIEQIVVMTHGPEVKPEDFELGHAIASGAEDSPDSSDVGTFKDEKDALLRKFEREYITAVLGIADGHVTKAAKRAGVDRKNLWQLMKRHDIKAEDFKPPE